MSTDDTSGSRRTGSIGEQSDASPRAGGTDAYTGHVEAGSGAATRELEDLRITKVSVGPMNNNAYLLEDRATGQVLLVDAADDAERLLAEIGDRVLAGVLTTHRHGDHWQALEAVTATHPEAVTYAHPADAGELPVATQVEVDDGAVVHLGQTSLTVVHLRGHTPGSVALLRTSVGEGEAGGSAAPHLWTGDSLFPGGPGNTFGDADAHRQLVDDLEERVFDRLPDTTWVYPGHGDDTTLGTERPSLAEWRERGW